MLSLVRKYQKSIFLVVTVMVICSFLFFGISNSIHHQARDKDWKYGTAVDGTSISGLEMKQLVRFISSDLSDLMVFENRGNPNLFNDGALKSEIIDTGIAQELYNRFEDQLKGDLEERFQKFQAYKPYEHPQKVIGTVSVWKHFGKEAGMYNEWENFKSLDSKMDEKSFDAIARLYLAQKKFPPGILRQILLYQQYQYGNKVQADQYLQSSDLAIFNAKTAIDWFGPKFVELAALFFHNGAIEAQKLGYRVSFIEARTSLVENLMKGLRLVEPNKNVSKEEFGRFMQRQLSLVNLSEDEAVKAWQKVLITRRWLDDAGSGVFVDSQLYRSYFDYAYKVAKIDHFKLPDAVNFKSIDDMLKFEIYLDAIGERDNLLDMPSRLYSIEEMKTRSPEFLEKRFIVDYSTQTREEIAVNVSLKNSLSWQLNESNWSRLVEEFPLLSSYSGDSQEDKHEYILKLNEKDRARIDAFVRSNIIDEHKEMIRETLARAKRTTKEIAIPLVKSGNVLNTLADHKTVLHLLESAPLRHESAEEADVESAVKLSCYTEDNDKFHSIRVIDRDREFYVMTFEKAKKSGVLDKILGEKLRNEYTNGRFKEGYDLQLPRLKEIAFNAILSEIERFENKDPTTFESVDKRLEFAAEHRMVSYMKQRLEDAKNGLFVEKSQKDYMLSKDHLQELPSLDESWFPVRLEESITRNLSHQNFEESLFEMRASSWSDVNVEHDSGVSFFQVLDSYIDTTPMEKRMREGRKFLSNEARQNMLSKFLDRSIESKALFIPVAEVEIDEDDQL